MISMSTMTKYGYDDYLEDQVYPYIVSTRRGTQTLNYLNIQPNKEYIIIATGWDDAPTTDDIAMLRFKGEEFSGIAANELQSVAVIGYEGRILIDGEYQGAAVSASDGKMIGSFRNSRSINVAPGVYVVRVQANNQTKNFKVLVR